MLGPMLKLLLVIQGDFGQRFVQNLESHSPSDWEVRAVTFPRHIRVSEDESPADFVPDALPSCDLLIMLQEEPVVAEMIPAISRRTGARAVIAPIDNKAFLPSGLARQLKNKLAREGVNMVFPLAFCSLTEKDSDDPLILTFLQRFGRPVVAVAAENDKVTDVRVSREAPCGNTRFVARQLVGTHIKDAVERAGILHHNHPCMATMTMDGELKDTLMHHAGLQIKLAVDEAIKRK